mgnify:CR=1 FL=1
MTLTSQIVRVMADGRERTFDDIHRKVPGDPDEVKRALRSLVNAKRIRTTHLGGGRQHHETIYRAAKEAAE